MSKVTPLIMLVVVLGVLSVGGCGSDEDSGNPDAAAASTPDP